MEIKQLNSVMMHMMANHITRGNKQAKKGERERKNNESNNKKRQNHKTTNGKMPCIISNGTLCTECINTRTIKKKYFYLT